MKLVKSTFNFHNDIRQRAAFQFVPETRAEAELLDEMLAKVRQADGQLRFLDIWDTPPEIKRSKRAQNPRFWVPWHGYPKH